MTEERLASAIERLAIAIEQAVLTQIPDAPKEAPSVAAFPEPPPIGSLTPPPAPSMTGVCPVHVKPWVLKPAGISKKTGKPYDAFYACNERTEDGSFCTQKPARPAA